MNDSDRFFKQFVREEVERRGISLTALSKAMKTSPQYIGQVLGRYPEKDRCRGLSLRKAEDFLHFLGKTWWHFAVYHKEQRDKEARGIEGVI